MLGVGQILILALPAAAGTNAPTGGFAAGVDFGFGQGEFWRGQADITAGATGGREAARKPGALICLNADVAARAAAAIGLQRCGGGLQHAPGRIDADVAAQCLTIGHRLPSVDQVVGFEGDATARYATGVERAGVDDGVAGIQNNFAD